MAKTQRERDAEKRKEKLDLIDEQIANGSLTVRKMTAKERARWARPAEGTRPSGRRGKR